MPDEAPASTYRLTFKETVETQEFTGKLEHNLSAHEFLDPKTILFGQAMKRSPIYSVRHQFIRDMEAGAAASESPLWRIERVPGGRMAYDTERERQGRLRRYLVALRVNPDLSLCPSADSMTTHIIWADEPYDAMSAAVILSKQQRGQLLRRVIGVEEYPSDA